MAFRKGTNHTLQPQHTKVVYVAFGRPRSVPTRSVTDVDASASLRGQRRAGPLRQVYRSLRSHGCSYGVAGSLGTQRSEWGHCLSRPWST